MIKLFNLLRYSLLSKISLAVGLLLFCTLGVWIYFNMRYHRLKVMERLIAQADIVSGTIQRATQHTMHRNLQAVLPEIINTIAQQKPIEAIRIYTNSGRATFADSDRPAPPPVDQRAPACQACHHTEPPSAILPPSATDRSGRFCG